MARKLVSRCTKIHFLRERTAHAALIAAAFAVAPVLTASTAFAIEDVLNDPLTLGAPLEFDPATAETATPRTVNENNLSETTKEPIETSSQTDSTANAPSDAETQSVEVETTAGTESGSESEAQDATLAAAQVKEHLAADSEVFDREKEAEAAIAFYEERGFAPVWISDSKLNDRAEAVLAAFADAESLGLDPGDYAIPASNAESLSTDALGAADVEITAAVLRYARHAYQGKVKPASLGKSIDVTGNSIEPAEILEEVSQVTDIADYLDGLHPAHPQFRALAKAYQEMLEAKRNGEEEAEKVVIPDGKLIKAGKVDERVALIRTRLEIPGGDNPAVYDEVVVDAVKAFQKENRLTPDGIVGPATLKALNGGPDNKLELLKANLERWRWAPRELGRTHVFVNVPFFSVAVNHSGAPIYEGRVVVGKRKHKTPVFSDVMEHIVVNPYWNVPHSIASREILPAVRNNPAYAHAFEVIPASALPRKVKRFGWMSRQTAEIDWNRVSASQVRFRQPPGPKNALGKVKFLFPNKHAVYLHDTPARSLFSRTVRAFSHGCIRLHEPMKFAEALVANDPKVSLAGIERLLGSQERWINLDTRIPVHITYFSAWANDGGEIVYANDIYGHDERTTEELKKTAETG